MPLSKDLLKTELQKFSDQLYPLFSGHPEDVKGLATKWSNALDIFIQSLTPPTTTSLTAKTAFFNSMLNLVPPPLNPTYSSPFTLAFISVDKRFRYFINYLINDLKYTVDKSLDKDERITIVKSILTAWNLQNPTLKLTEDDIIYNQAFHNQQWRIEPLMQPRYDLQVDGIIGDDTILYRPIIVHNERQTIGGVSSKYMTDFINEYNEKVVGSPAGTGDILWLIYKRGVPVFSSIGRIYYEWVKKGKVKDYLKFSLDKTQSDLPEINYVSLSGTSDDSKPMDFYSKLFEANHAAMDPYWSKNHITTISQLDTFSLKDKVLYESLPQNKINSIALLEDSLLIYASNLSPGMTPAFTGVPPQVKIDLKPITNLSNTGATSERVMDLLATTIINWLMTGTATNNSTGVVTTWI